MMSPAGAAAVDVAPQTTAVNSEANLQLATKRLLRLVEQVFPYYATGGVIYGWREDPIPDHPSGQALDIMLANDGRDLLSVSDGTRIAAWLIANAQELGVEYLVFRQHIWSVQQPYWRAMEDRGDWTQNHMNHVHAKVYGEHLSSGPIVMPDFMPASPTELPDVAKLMLVGEKQRQLTAAQDSLAAAKQTLAKFRKQTGQRTAELSEAQDTINHQARDAYMYGFDPGLLPGMSFLYNEGAPDVAAAIAMDRQLRDRDAEVEDALDSLDEAKLTQAKVDADVAQAQADADKAQHELNAAMVALNAG